MAAEEEWHFALEGGDVGEEVAEAFEALGLFEEGHDECAGGCAEGGAHDGIEGVMAGGVDFEEVGDFVDAAGIEEFLIEAAVALADAPCVCFAEAFDEPWRDVEAGVFGVFLAEGAFVDEGGGDVGEEGGVVDAAADVDVELDLVSGFVDEDALGDGAIRGGFPLDAAEVDVDGDFPGVGVVFGEAEEVGFGVFGEHGDGAAEGEVGAGDAELFGAADGCAGGGGDVRGLG